MKAVILAGGKGRRLRPFTHVIPKPLLPVGDKPVLEHIFQHLKKHGISEIILATGHLSKLITAYFGDGSAYGIKITYTEEKKPLGTAGPLSLCKSLLDDTFLVMNGDVLTSLDIKAFTAYHKRKKSELTMALYERREQSEYGVVELGTDNQVETIKEKPQRQDLINMGVYLMEPSVLDLVTADTYLDLPELLRKVNEGTGKVFGYPFSGKWIDIGSKKDYLSVNES